MTRTTTLAACAATALLAGCVATGPAVIPDAAPPAEVAPAPIAVPSIRHPQDETAAWWFRSGAAAAHARGSSRARARNLILFVGDGMSLPTVAAARILEGQRRGAPGEENALSFERFGHTALSKTYNTDSQTPDSAGTMTAMITGAKTAIGMMSVGQSAANRDCAASRAARLPTLLEIAEDAGLATGIVTNTRLTHATPGAAFGHVPDRGWEVDGWMPADARAAGCTDLARQFVEFESGDGIDVALAGGRALFLPETARDPEYPEQTGARTDGRDLVAAWRARHPDGAFVIDAKGLATVDTARTARLLGLFDPGHMKFAHDRAGDRGGEPTLEQMTRTAIALLSRHADGFVLVVEGGKIDHAHHMGNAYRALDETVALSDAVRAADALTDDADTLILVTADHAHTLTFAGYPTRGNPILGKVMGSGEDGGSDGMALDKLGLPFTTLGYANGPGNTGASDSQPAGPKRFGHEPGKYAAAVGRPDLRRVDTTDPDYLQEALVPGSSESHGGDDVGIWAHGAGAEAVRGTVEQHVIFHFLLQASPALRAHACTLADCEQGVPVGLPVVRGR